MSIETGIFSRMPVLRRFLEVWLALIVSEELEYCVAFVDGASEGLHFVYVVFPWSFLDLGRKSDWSSLMSKVSPLVFMNAFMS